jgi:hypothetical protein
MVRMIGGIPRPFGEDKDTSGNTSRVATMGVAVTIVLSALAGGGVGGATSIGEASSELSIRAPRSEPDAQTTGIRDAIKMTSRLKRLGYRVKFQFEHTDRHCEDNSDGDVQIFFRATECLSLYRVVYEIQAKYGVLLLSMATVVMPDEQAAIQLRALLDQATRGKISPLISPSGKYSHFSFVNALFCTTRDGATVTTYDAKPVGHTVGSTALDALLISVLSGSC